MKADFDYNREGDILRVLKEGADISESADFGNIFVDFSKDLNVVGLEIVDASKILSLSKEFLSELKCVDMKIYETSVGVNIVLVLADERATERVSFPIALKAAITA